MKFTVEFNELYDSMGFAILTVSLAMEYYRIRTRIMRGRGSQCGRRLCDRYAH
jgi:hypothetical protein